MRKMGKRWVAGMLALVMAWNSLGITEYQVHATGASETFSASDSQEAAAWEPETEGVLRDAAGEDAGVRSEGETHQTAEPSEAAEGQAASYVELDDVTGLQTELQAAEEQAAAETEEAAEMAGAAEAVDEQTPDEQPEEADDRMADGQAEEAADALVDEALALYFADEDRLPATVQEIIDSPKTSYSILNPEDMNKLAELSKNYSFEGITLKLALVNNQSGGTSWVLNNNFQGLGSLDHPFKGKLVEHYGTSSVKFKMPRPLFECIGSGAGLVNFDIELTNTRFNSGLATYYVVDSDAPVTFDSVSVKSGKNIAGSNDVNLPVGGIFGTIRNKLYNPEQVNDDESEYEVKLDGKGINVSGLYLWGKVVGGYVGRVEGKVRLNVSDGSKAAASVSLINVAGVSCAIGGLVGELTGGSTFEVTKDIKVSNSVVMNADNADYEGKCDAVGGIVGLCQNGAKILSEKKVTRTSDMMIHNKYVGGYVGYVKNAKAVIRNFQLDAKVRLYNNYELSRNRAVGGVVGFYEVAGENLTSEDIAGMGLEISRIGISKQIISNGDDGWIIVQNNRGPYEYYQNQTGGVAGYISAGGSRVVIQEISSEGTLGGAFLPALQYDTHRDSTEKTLGSVGAIGGLVGRLSGSDIHMANLTLRFNSTTGLGGAYTGGIAGYVEPDTAISVEGVTVKEFFKAYALARDYREYKVGGLFGYVLDGSIIRLGGIVDLEAIGKSSFSDDRVGSYSNWDYRKWGNRGYIAGYQNESLIYLDMGAVYKRGKDVKASNWYEDASWEANEYWTTSLTSPGDANKGYVIDDIGTYGGLYRNVMDGDSPVIDYGSRKLSGTVEKADGRYQIKGVADALRMAAALNTFDQDGNKALRFGTAECFGGADLTAEDLLTADYTVTADLNLAEAGIYSLIRNDGVTSNAAPSEFGGTSFRGSLWGALKADNTYPTVTLSIFSRQEFGGLFPCVDGGNGKSFKNLNLAGYVYFNHSDYEHVSAAGGLAAYATGSISLENVNVLLNMKTGSYQYSYTNYYAGGLFGRYDLKDGQVFSYVGGRVAPTIGNVRTFQPAGGLVGCLITEKKKAAADNVILRNIELAAQMKTPARMNRGMTSYYVHSKMSALISYMGWTEIRNNMHGSAYLSTTDISFGEPTAKVLLDGITADGVRMTCTTDSGGNYIRSMGGLLGYEWDNAQIRMTGTNVVKNCTMTGNGHMGGLFTTLACSSFDMTEEGASLKLESLSMTNTAPSSSYKWTYSSFLIGDGRYALVNLNIDAYKIESGTTCTKFNHFDEIVGVSYAIDNNYINELNRAVIPDYNRCGIVNLICPGFKQNYQTYQNQVLNMSNKNTRYYYNLFDRPASSPLSKVHVTDSETVIACEEDLMIWHAYFNSGEQIRSYMRDYFDGEPKWSFKVTDNMLDMTHYSLYPTCVPQGIHGKYDFGTAVLKLDGETIENSEKAHTGWDVNKRYPYDVNKQHYLMHAGLFYNISGTVSVNGDINDTASDSSLKIQGTCTFPQYSQNGLSGAVIVGACKGTCYLNHLVCDGIRVTGYNNHVKAGLLVGTVADGGTLFMNDIRTTGQYAQDYPPRKKAASSSLIGVVGGSTARNVHVEFNRMQVGGVTTTKEVEGQETTTFAPGCLKDAAKNYVFYRASFIDYYDTRDNADINQSLVIYRFSENEFNTNDITFGEELSYGVDYRDKPKDGKLQAVIDVAAATYLRYIKSSKTLLINPASGNLDKGCGTYEDPYQISTPMQFIMLSAYLNASDSGDSRFTALNAGAPWQVNPIGGAAGDPDRCVVKYSDETHHTPVTVESPNFPGRDGLRKAYYQITNDLDLSTYKDLNEYVLMSDFSGLGTAKYPFCGVIVGKDFTDPTVRHPKITLPASANDWEYYGLIQYMKGAVVKDLEICYSQSLPGSDAVYYVKLAAGGVGGGVAAVVLGGDNIIDDVKISTLEYQGAQDNATFTTGGYVGLVKAGTLIVRNVTPGYLAGYNCRYNISKVTGRLRKDEKYPNYQRNSQIVGFVEDGCVIYEDTKGENTVPADKPVLERGDLGFSITETVGEEQQTVELLPLSNSFPMLNGKYLENQCVANKVVVSGTADKEHGFVIQIHNAAQLEIAALALNQGAFSIQDTGSSDLTNSYAYDYTAVCRAALYEYIGQEKTQYDDTGTDTGKDFAAATGRDDNICYEPYLYRKYMSFETTGDQPENYLNTMKMETKTVGGREVTTHQSYLNWLTQAATDAEMASTGGEAYSPRGIGRILTTYRLDGSLTYDMTVYGRSFRGFGEVYEADSVTYDGSTVPKYNTSRFRANFEGNNAKVKICMEQDWDTANRKTIGMFNDLTVDRQPDTAVPADEGGFRIQDIEITNSTFNSEDVAGVTTGALAGSCRGVWQFSNISLTGDSTVRGRSHTGGLIGQIRYYYLSSSNPAKQAIGELQNIRFQNCKVEGESAANPCGISGSFFVGGLAGWVEGTTANNSTHFGNIRVEDCQVKNADVLVNALGGDGVRLVGGLFGRVGYSYNNQSNTFNDGSGQSFGVVEISQSDPAEKTIENVRVGSSGDTPNALCGAGGLVGMYTSFYSSNNRTDNCFRVKGVRIDHLQLNGRTSYVGGKYAVGGVAGTVFTNRLFVEDVQVKGSTIGTADLTQPADNTDHARAGDAKITAHSSEYRLNAGGIVGVPYVHRAHITQTTVEDCYIETYGGAAGGFIGDSQCRTTLEIGTVNFKAEGGKHLCTVCDYIDLGEDPVSGSVVSKGNTIRSWAAPAGGIVGYNSSAINNTPTWTFREIDVDGCTVFSGVTSDNAEGTQITSGDSYTAGGILGRTDRYIGSFNLTNIRVGGGSAIAGVHAGGLIGRVSSDYKIPINLAGDILVGCSRQEDAETVTYPADGTHSVIFALNNAGGIYGWHQGSGEEKSKAVIRVCGLRLGSSNSTGDYNYATAGGVAGRREITAMVKYDSLSVEDCVLAVNHTRADPPVAAGGIYGRMTGSNTVYLYRPEMKNNSIGFMPGLKGVEQLKNMEPSGGTNDDEKLMLLYDGDGSGVNRENVKLWNDVKNNVGETELGDYALRLGNFVGYSSDEVILYALHAALSFEENFSGSRPVTDVGNYSRLESNYEEAYGCGYPYAWRKNCHLIYLDGMDSAPANVIPQGLQLKVDGKYVPGHLFQNVDTLAGKYVKAAKGDALIANYRLHARMDDIRYIFSPEGDDAKETSYYKKTFTNDLQKHLVFDGVSPQTGLDSIIGILTNMGGVVQPSGTTVNNPLLKITAVKAKIKDDGTITKDGVSGKASLKVVGDRYVQNETNVYDEINSTDKSRTITLLQILYSWKGVDDKTKAEVLYIPICVMQRVDLYSDLHILEGERYSLTDAHNTDISLTSDNTTLKLSHNSAFTLFSEFGYSAGRKKAEFQSFKVEKTLTFEVRAADGVNWEYAALPVGLRLTLVDAQTNHAYYYQVEESDNSDEKKGRIDFTAFQDENGHKIETSQLKDVPSSTSYQYRNQSSMKGQDFGVEQFFIYVDSTDVQDMKSVIYRIHVDTGKTDDEAENFIDNTESGGIVINWDAGLEIQFYDKKENRAGGQDAAASQPVTSVTGAISKEEPLVINTRFAITASEVYWDEKAQAGTTYIDSVNNGKYLDIAVYLYDTAMEQVPFPASTMVTWTGPDGEKEQRTITQETVLYGYKDWGGSGYSFQIADVEENMEAARIIPMGSSNVPVSNECHLELDFSTANLDDYIGNTYNVVVELRRSTDPDYPLGGDVVDETTGSVQCTGSKEYAVAMEVGNSLNLGINTYNQTEAVHRIPFQTRLDFSSWIINNRDADIARCADKNYRVTYRLKRKEKTANGYDYKSVDKGEAAAKQLGRAFRLLLTDSEGNSAAQTLELKKYGTGDQEEWVYQTVMQFNKNQIVDGDGTGITYVTGWNAVLSVDTTDLGDADYSNYQLEVTILPYDKTLSGDQIPSSDTDLEEGEKVWRDYFIFTIARLKTDI